MTKLALQAALEKQKSEMDNKHRCPYQFVVGLCLFVLLQIAWFTINLIYFFRGNIFRCIVHDKFFVIKLTNFGNETIDTLPTYIYQNGVGLTIWLTVTGIMFFLLFLKTLTWIPTFWTVSGLLLLYGVLLGHLFRCIYLLLVQSPDDVPPSFAEIVDPEGFGFFKLVVPLTIFVAIIFATNRASTQRLAEVIKKTSCAIFFSSILLLFGLFTLISSFTVIIFTVAFYCKDNGQYYGIFNLLCGTYLTLVIWNFGLAVIADCVYSWFLAKYNKEDLPSYPVLQSIHRVARYKGACILSISTMILPALSLLHMICAKSFKSGEGFGFRAFFVKCWLFLTNKNFFISLFRPRGTCTREETLKIYNLLIRSMIVKFSFCGVFGTIISIFLILARLLSVLLAFAVFHSKSLYDNDFLEATTIYYNMGVVGVIITSLVVGACVIVFHTHNEFGNAVVVALANGEKTEMEFEEVVVEKPTGVVEKPTGVVEKPTGVAEKPTGVVEKPTGVVEKPTDVVEKPTGVVETEKVEGEKLEVEKVKEAVVEIPTNKVEADVK